VLDKNALKLAQKCAGANKAGHMGTLLGTDPDEAAVRNHFPAVPFRLQKGTPMASPPYNPSGVAISTTRQRHRAQWGLAARRPRASDTPAPRGSSTVPISNFKSQQRNPAAACAAQSLASPGSSRVPPEVRSK
jgi:hypothetical protein